MDVFCLAGHESFCARVDMAVCVVAWPLSSGNNCSRGLTDIVASKILPQLYTLLSTLAFRKCHRPSISTVPKRSALMRCNLGSINVNKGYKEIVILTFGSMSDALASPMAHPFIDCQKQ
jgi:hypothetical protein